MRRPLYIICGLVLAAFLLLFSLNAAIDKPNKYKNGFNRNITTNALQIDKEIPLPGDASTICNVTNETVYLQSEKAGVVYFTKDFKRMDTLRLAVSVVPALRHPFFTIVHFPNVFILDVNGRRLVKGNFQTGGSSAIALQTPGPDSKPVWLSDRKIVVRCVDTATLDALFYKIDPLEGNAAIEKNVSERLGDAGFINDGTLLYDAKLQQLVFVNYYSNRISVFDTNLALLNRYHTIDTVTRAGVSLSISKQGIKSVTHKKPPRMINGPTSVYDAVLYVRSYLKGDNEQEFDNNIPIDRYSLTSGKYIGSIYLPYQSREKLESFMVTDKYLYALFRNKLVRMKINK